MPGRADGCGPAGVGSSGFGTSGAISNRRATGFQSSERRRRDSDLSGPAAAARGLLPLHFRRKCAAPGLLAPTPGRPPEILRPAAPRGGIVGGRLQPGYESGPAARANRAGPAARGGPGRPSRYARARPRENAHERSLRGPRAQASESASGPRLHRPSAREERGGPRSTDGHCTSAGYCPFCGGCLEVGGMGRPGGGERRPVSRRKL